MKAQLPRNIQRLFWDMDSSLLDIRTHKRTIIERILNNGNLSDWRWLRSVYGTNEVRGALARDLPFGRDGIRPGSRRLASLIMK